MVYKIYKVTKDACKILKDKGFNVNYKGSTGRNSIYLDNRAKVSEFIFKNNIYNFNHKRYKNTKNERERMVDDLVQYSLDKIEEVQTDKTYAKHTEVYNYAIHKFGYAYTNYINPKNPCLNLYGKEGVIDIYLRFDLENNSLFTSFSKKYPIGNQIFSQEIFREIIKVNEIDKKFIESIHSNILKTVENLEHLDFIYKTLFDDLMHTTLSDNIENMEFKNEK